MDKSSIKALLEDLKNSDELIRNKATGELWRIWFEEKGVAGLEAIRRSEHWLQVGVIEEAEAILNKLIEDLPDFGEAWNRRAVLYYTLGEYRKAAKDCEMVVKLNPFHFGAWHGLGLCYVGLGEYREAILAFKKALEIQPYAIQNQRLILECTARLS
ncbi:tetratricopeptide repeat protein [Hydrocoleum sp. CS-953]|uniref:tetratricopeptide repeat protein n=1 Tax=Microcoleaceae TaxID=1892252 RepID=UPI000B9A7F72|nr:tetratricopeptide repeat protein [Hydrocoleum sp. CS-953]OZH54513.1 tetratricopeptide repeat protein [Hydrocoleum sp. CS-953]